MTRGRLAAAALGLVAGLLLGEAIIRLTAPQLHRRPRVWEFDERLGWRHRPGSSGLLVSPEFSVPVEISADGLRDRLYPRAKPSGTWRLLAFGDSFIEGWGVPVQASVSKVLEQKLQQARPGQATEVLNLGVAGYGTDQELLLYQAQGRSYAPDLVLVFFYANDLWNNAVDRGIGAERGYKPYFRPGPDGRPALLGVPVRKVPQWDDAWWDGQPWSHRLDRALSEHLHLYALARKAAQPEELAAGQRQEYYQGLFGAVGEPRPAALWSLTGPLLSAFADQVEKDGARLVLVYVPSIVQVEEADWRAKRELGRLSGSFDLERPNRELAAIAAGRGVRLIDLTAVFREQSATRVLYFRDSHWNEAGHALAAEVVAAALLAGSEAPGGAP